MYGYDNYEYNEPNEFQEIIENLVKKETDRRVKEIKDEYAESVKKNKEYRKKIKTIEKEKDNLSTTVKSINNFKIFSNMITIDNIEALFNLLNLKKETAPIDSFDSEKNNPCFKILWKFYPDREKVFQLFEMFDIKYDKSMKNFVIPYEYTKNQVLQFVKTSSRRYITNGNIFSHNTRWFYENLKSSNFSTTNTLELSRYSNAIPWQLLLKNKYILDDDVFDEILNQIKLNHGNSCYFYKIIDFHELNNEQLEQMALLLPTERRRINDTHKNFISKNVNILKTLPLMVDSFSKEINDNQYTAFYFANYPDDYQVEYIKKQRGFEYKLSLIKKSSLPNDARRTLIEEMTNNYIDSVEN